MAKKAKKTSAGNKSQDSKGESVLTAKDLEFFQDILLVKRRQLLGDVNEMEDEALKQSRLDASGDLSSMPIHMADLGSDNYSQELALGLMDTERKLLRQIDEALERITEGTYGICLATGKPIVRARLEAKPWARYGVEHARKLEESGVSGPEVYEDEIEE